MGGVGMYGLGEGGGTMGLLVLEGGDVSSLGGDTEGGGGAGAGVSVFATSIRTAKPARYHIIAHTEGEK